MTLGFDTPVLSRLAHVSEAHGALALGDRLASLDRWVRADLVDLEAELAAIPRGERVVHLAAHHLLDRGGKHLRPLCVALASRFGEGFTPRARSLAVAVELVHSATLLHDDVIDVADRRRGEPAARIVYGNAASIFAGDWLLVTALRRIASANVDGLVESMLAVIEEMIVAESVQLERRGRVEGAREDYTRIVEGKTCALFRWAMQAGARVAGLSAADQTALDRYGFHLGFAFQAVDDELDFAEGNSTGKDPLVDLREGKMTYPLVVALERDPSLKDRIVGLLEAGASDAELATIAQRVRACGALTVTRRLAEDHMQRSLEALSQLPAGPARDALETVSLALAPEDVVSTPESPNLGSGAMFDRIAPRYDLVNRVLSLGLDHSWRRRTVDALVLGDRPRVLDLATGTGDLAIEIANRSPGAHVIGLDPSPNMLAIARTKVDKRGYADRVTLAIGDAQELPFASCELDAATMAFGIRNVPDRDKALRELARVVRPGGRIGVLELGEPRRGFWGSAARFHSHVLVPAIGGLLSGQREYAYLQKSVAAFPPAAEFAEQMKRAGLDVISVEPMTFGVCTLYVATPK